MRGSPAIAACLFAIGVLVLSCFANPNKPERPQPSTTTLWAASTICVTTLEGEVRPKTFIDLELIGTPWTPELVAHEQVHAAQIRRFSSCKDWSDWNQANRISAEAEAYCASALTDAAIGRASKDNAIRYYASLLSAGYTEYFIITPDSAETVMRSICDVGVQ